MPPLDQVPANLLALKLLLMGEALAGKTHYAMQAAEKFNVLYIDGDVAMRTLKNLPVEAQRRVKYMPVHDYMDDSGTMVSNFAEFLVAFTTTPKLLWNDTLGRIFDRKTYVPGEGGHTIWEIKPSKMDANTVIIIDSWTALVSSIVQWKAADLNVDLLDIEKLERDMYTGTGHKGTQFLTLLKTLKCHVIVTAHPREYIKRSAPPGSKGQVPERDMKIDWIKMVPMSTSNPHGLTLAKNFSDVGWITMSATGERSIDFKPDQSRVIGGKLNDKKLVKDWPIWKLIEDTGFQVPQNPGTDEWFTEYPNGTYEVPMSAAQKALAAKEATGAEPIQPATAEPKKISLGGLSGLKASGVQR